MHELFCSCVHRPVGVRLTGPCSRMFRKSCGRRWLDSEHLSGSLPSWLGSLTGLSFLCVAAPRVGVSARGTANAHYYCRRGASVLLLCVKPILRSRVCLRSCARRYLGDNQLSGSLPRSLGSLTGLRYMCVVVLCASSSPRHRDFTWLLCSSHGASSFRAAFVAWLRSLWSRLCIPSFFRVSPCGRRKLEYNNLSGSLPSSLASMQNLYSLYVVVVSVGALASGTATAPLLQLHCFFPAGALLRPFVVWVRSLYSWVCLRSSARRYINANQLSGQVPIWLGLMPLHDLCVFVLSTKASARGSPPHMGLPTLCFVSDRALCRCAGTLASTGWWARCRARPDC